MIHSSIDSFQPELQPNSEQKADEMHVCPAIANALVVGWRLVKPNLPYVTLIEKILPNMYKLCAKFQVVRESHLPPETYKATSALKEPLNHK